MLQFESPSFEHADPESFAAFYRLFHISMYRPAEDGRFPIDVIEEESRRHAEKVSDDLKRVVFTVAETFVRALLADASSRGAVRSTSGTDGEYLRKFRDAALRGIYRILFILYAEARDLRLSSNRIYWDNYSIHGLVEFMLRDPYRDWPENRAGLWARILALFRVYDRGLPSIDPYEQIPPRGSDFFRDDTAEGKILAEARLPDSSISCLLLDLTTTLPRRGVGRERISFRELDIENLGAVYEGLLEYEPRVATETLLELRVQGKTYALSISDTVRLCEEKKLVVHGDPALVEGTEVAVLHPDISEDDGDTEEDSEVVAEGTETDVGEEEEEDEGLKKGVVARILRRLEPGSFHFVPGSARKGSGSFYTPLPLVRDLVRHALGPITRGKGVDEIERLRVLDPACGSAHFLVEAMRFMGQELHRAYVDEYEGKPPVLFCRGEWDTDWKMNDADARSANSEARAWCKRRIAERCLFGVDLNPMAVALAHVSLWIESLAGDRPLSYFEHHVRCGNSLLGTWRDRLDAPLIITASGKTGKAAKADTEVAQRDLFGDLVRQVLEEAAEKRRVIDVPDPDALRREGIEPESVAEQAVKEHQRTAEYSGAN